jgi:hypothetical protein
MKIIFNKSTVMSAVAPLMCAVSGKSVLSTIEGILIEAKVPDICVLTTYDLDGTTIPLPIIAGELFINISSPQSSEDVPHL